jgi:hypothetical protein
METLRSGVKMRPLIWPDAASGGALDRKTARTAVLAGLFFGLALFTVTMPKSNPVQPKSITQIEPGTLALKINFETPGLASTDSKNIYLRLDKPTGTTVHMNVESHSAWVLLTSGSLIRDAATREILKGMDIMVRVNGGRPRTIGEMMKTIEPGLMESGVDLTIELVRKDGVSDIDLSKSYQSEITFRALGTF